MKCYDIELEASNFEKVPLEIEKNIMKEKSLKKIENNFFQIFFFSDFFLWSPKVGFSGKGPPIDFLRISSEFVFEKVPHGIEKNIMKEKSEKKLKIFFFQIFFFRFFPLVPQGRFFQVRVPSMDFFSDFFFHYKLNCEL